jgi:hypothetical protein
VRRKRNAQAIVEFGIIALLFVMILFAVIDIGLLLNSWLAVSSGTREIARNASVGKHQDFLQSQSKKLNLPSISATNFSGLCCSASSAIEVRVEYFDRTCPPWQSGCSPISSAPNVSVDYPLLDVDHHGSGPDAATCATTPTCHPQADDLVRVTILAHGAQVITPLIRPFFGCTDSASPQCNVELRSSTVMRFEGQEF